MKIKCNGQDILSNNFTDKDKRKLDSVQPCANYYKHPTTEGYKHLPAGGQEGQVIAYDGTNATWKNLADLLPDIDNLLAYGVQFDTTIADPHLIRIGNLLWHKTLPIQSQLKGCIAKGGEVQYWLDKNDWRFRKNPITVSINLTVAEGVYTIVNDIFSTLQYEKQWIKIDSVICQIDSINTETKTATLVANEELTALALTTGIKEIELGAVLNGYDGTVRVYCPEFYIKSTVEGTVCKVFITPIKIDDTYTHQSAVLIDAYRSTVLNTVPENMGYLSTLPVNSAISVVNNNIYCRGSKNRNNYDTYLTTDQFRTDLNKPRTFISKPNMRTYARNANSQLLSYDQYKNIFYWLYVIEYANFNSQESYDATLTNNGYKQGGLGIGITNMYNWEKYNESCPLTPCGYGNDIGNNTGIKNLIIPKFTYTVTSVPVNAYKKNINSNIVNSDNNGVTITKIGFTHDVLVGDSTNVFGKVVYEISGLTNGQTVLFREVRNNKYVDIATASTDGSITVNWSNYKVNNYRCIWFGKDQDECNITIYASFRTTETITVHQQDMQMPRWRGFDNPFGDIWTNLDGIIVDADANNHPNNMDWVYTCQDANNYSDSINSSYHKVGERIHTDGYITSFDLGNAAHIIPHTVGGSSTTYMCDLNTPGAKNTSLRMVLASGYADMGSYTGLGSFSSHAVMSKYWPPLGFQTVSDFISSPAYN